MRIDRAKKINGWNKSASESMDNCPTQQRANEQNSMNKLVENENKWMNEWMNERTT